MIDRLVTWVLEPAPAQKPLTRWMNLRCMMVVMGLVGCAVGMGLMMVSDGVAFLKGEELTVSEAIASVIAGLFLMVLGLVAGCWAWRHERERLGQGTPFAEELLPPTPPAERWAGKARLIWAAISVVFVGMAVFLGVGMAVGGLNDDPASARWLVGCMIGGLGWSGMFLAVVAMRWHRRWRLDKVVQ